MKFLSLLAFVVLTSCAAAVSAEGHLFPGKGDKPKWDEANTLFNEGIVFFRSAPKGGKGEGVAYDKAIAKFKEAIAIYPYDYEYFNNLGLAYKKKNEFDAAAEALKHSIELQPNVWENWSNLGSVYKHQGHVSDAVDAYSKALQLNPPLKSKQLLQQNVNALKAQLTPAQPL